MAARVHSRLHSRAWRANVIRIGSFGGGAFRGGTFGGGAFGGGAFGGGYSSSNPRQWLGALWRGLPPLGVSSRPEPSGTPQEGAGAELGHYRAPGRSTGCSCRFAQTACSTAGQSWLSPSWSSPGPRDRGGAGRDEGRWCLAPRAGGVRTLCEESTGPYCSSDCCAWPHMPLRTSWSVVLQSGSGPFTGSGRLRSGILAVLSGWYLCGARQAGARLPCSGRTRPREGCAL